MLAHVKDFASSPGESISPHSQRRHRDDAGHWGALPRGDGGALLWAAGWGTPRAARLVDVLAVALPQTDAITYQHGRQSLVQRFPVARV